MNKFNKGDKVRAIGSLAIDGEHNRLGIIERVIGEESWVLWETDIGQFSCIVPNRQLELISRTSKPISIESDTELFKDTQEGETLDTKLYKNESPYIYEDGVLKYNKSTSIYLCPICNKEIKYNFFGSEFGFICGKCNDKKIPHTDTTIQVDTENDLMNETEYQPMGTQAPVGLDYEAKDDLVNRIIVIVAAGINDESLFEECLKDIISQYDISELI
jgi:hypothetical protein